MGMMEGEAGGAVRWTCFSAADVGEHAGWTEAGGEEGGVLGHQAVCELRVEEGYAGAGLSRSVRGLEFIHYSGQTGRSEQNRLPICILSDLVYFLMVRLQSRGARH